VAGVLNAPACWNGPFDLAPDYFAADVFTRDDTLQIRIQRGGDFQNFSDGMTITVPGLSDARRRLAESKTSPPSVSFRVALAPGVVPPNAPVQPEADPPRVHANLYLQQSCKPQNVALHALERVALGPSGECDGPLAPKAECSPGGLAPNPVGKVTLPDREPENDASTPQGPLGPPSPRPDDASANEGLTGESVITFVSLFSGNPDATSPAERLTKAYFRFFLGDPRDRCVPSDARPPPCRGALEGKFAFYFQRGRPLQPFP
jgi:hypothetical protein